MEAEKSGQAATSSQLSWLATDEIPDALAEHWQEPAIAPDTLAMLQYTSGSTSRPKGVMVSHANLMANIRAIHQAFGVQPGDSSVFWLPMYHDMGLVGGVLVPVFAGATNVSHLAGHVPPEPHHLAGRHQQVSGYHLRRAQLRLRSLYSQNHRRAACHPRPFLLGTGLRRRRTH